MTDSESRGAAILLPGATLADPSDKTELSDKKDEEAPDLIKIDGKLYVRQDSPFTKLAPRDKKKSAMCIVRNIGINPIVLPISKRILLPCGEALVPESDVTGVEYRALVARDLVRVIALATGKYVEF